MSFEAQSEFLERFINTQGLKDVHIVAPDIAMPVALHYVIHRDHKVKSLMVGDGPGILPSKDGSLIRKIVVGLLANYGPPERSENLYCWRNATWLSALQPYMRWLKTM